MSFYRDRVVKVQLTDEMGLIWRAKAEVLLARRLHEPGI